MNPDVVARALAQWRAAAVAEVGEEAFYDFLLENHEAVLEVAAEAVRGPSTQPAATDSKPAKGRVSKPRAKKSSSRQNRRIANNLAAIAALEQQGPRAALLKYTGWGGIPADELAAHNIAPGVDEHYTPQVVADALGRALAPLLPGLTDIHGHVHALEPAAGTGVLIRSLEAHASVPVVWSAVEVEPTAAAILGRLHPEIKVYQQPFEDWVHEHGASLRGSLRLVLGNPPFYRNGLTPADDDPDYREAHSHAYFLRRGLDLLAPGGLLVMLMPRSFLHAAKYGELRRRVLQTAHLVAAFRLPQRVFDGAAMQVDIVVLRARQSQLPAVLPEDKFIIEPDGYFQKHPNHALTLKSGQLDIPLAASCCAACKKSPAEPKLPTVKPIKPAPGCCLVAAACHLGMRLQTLRQKVAAHQPEARALWAELRRDVADFQQHQPNPWTWSGLTRAAKRSTGAQAYSQAFTQAGSYAEWFERAPAAQPYRGRAQAIVDQAAWLYEQAYAPVHVDELLELHQSVGGQLSREQATSQLFASGWVRTSTNTVEPEEAYYRGDLWKKRDNLHGALIVEQVQKQARKLDELIAAVPIEDVDLSPRAGWLPVAAISHWASTYFGRRVTLQKTDGVLLARGLQYDELDNAEELHRLLRWLNHDPKARPSAENVQRWCQHFQTWATAQKHRRHQLADAYNRAARGYRCTEAPGRYNYAPRWNREVALHSFQEPVVRGVVEQMQGLVALDTGLGKTYVALAALATARSRGLARRPVVVVPKSLVWKWFDAFATVLPDYRVAVLGSHRVELRGADLERLQAEHRAGTITDLEYENRRVRSMVDSPVSRIAKWKAFAAGAYDAVLMTTSVMEHCAVGPETLAAYNKSPAISRMHAMGRGFEEVAGDTTMMWDQVVDFLVVDEAADYRNLFMPHRPPKYLGAGTSSRRARALHLRAFATRRKAERGGVVLLTATPGKNSPVDVFNLLHIIDPQIWERAGIRHHEAFIDRYMRVETVPTLTTALAIVEKPAVVGFRNMAELRGLLCRYMYHRTAEEVGGELQLPIPRKHLVEVDLDARQREKYAHYRRNAKDSLGTQVKLSLVAVHSELDVHTWESANGVDPMSPKFAAIAERIASNIDCGHIVFLENLAAHKWLRQVLVNTGIPRERIAMMNGRTAHKSSARLKIAEAFNRGTVAVVIANRVAYEGLDLQTRTCAVHHGDLPWLPEDLRQRNGRAWRYGNRRNVLEIYYYLAKDSLDGYRLAQIDGKENSWLRELIAGKDIIRNPAAALFLDSGELIRALAVDTQDADTQSLLEDADRSAQARQRQRARQAANRLVYRAAARFRDAREGTGDPLLDRRRRREAEELLGQLNQVDRNIWPWARWMAAIEHVMPLVPEDGSMPVYEGLRITRMMQGQRQAIEFGRLSTVEGQPVIGMRDAGKATWSPATIEEVAALEITPEHLPGNTPTPWPESDAAKAAEHAKALAANLATTSWPELYAWHLAADQFVDVVWPQVCANVIEELRKHDSEQFYPVITSNGETLALVPGAKLGEGALLAPSLSGWRMYLQRNGESNYPLEALETAAAFWWGRSLGDTDVS